MADDHDPKRSEASGADLGWTALGYLIAGVGVWGFVGFLIDEWLGFPQIGLMVGMMVGAAAAIYLIVRRMSKL